MNPSVSKCNTLRDVLLPLLAQRSLLLQLICDVLVNYVICLVVIVAGWVYAYCFPNGFLTFHANIVNCSFILLKRVIYFYSCRKLNHSSVINQTE